MGQPRIYVPLSTLSYITVPAFQVFEVQTAGSGDIAHGYGAPYALGMGERIYLTIEALIDPSAYPLTVDGLRSVGSHLRQGGSIGISLDRDKTWAAPVTIAALANGDTDTTTTTSAYTAWEASATEPAIGDRIAYDPVAPLYNSEERTVIARPSTAPGTAKFTTSPLFYAHATGDLVRWADFYPSLYLESFGEESFFFFEPEDRRRLLYLLRARLRYVPNPTAPS